MGIRRAGVVFAIFVMLFAVAPRAFAQPSITIDSATFTVGRAGSIEISAPGATAITHSGNLPSGVSFTDNGDESATIAGTPAAGTQGSYPITIFASDEPANTLPDTTCGDAESDSCSAQSFTLVVLAAPATPVPVSNVASCQTLNASQTADTTFVRGERFFVRGTLPGVRNVSILWNGGLRIGGDGADAGGRYIVSAQIPSRAVLGANTVVARGLAGSTPVTATCALTVLSGGVAAPVATARPSGTATLPRTGVPMSVLVAVGVTMVELGAGLLLFADRRRAQPVIAPYLDRLINRLER